MEKIVRPNAPAFLIDNYKRWGRQYEALRARNPQAQFQWYQHSNQKVNILLLPYLQLMTQSHCSFCDIFEVTENVVEPTVEHFKPSSRFPILSYYWGNLFLCCNSCQKKNDRFEDYLLKPDRLDYLFDDYFLIDWVTGKIFEKHTLPDLRYFKAEATIRLYGLNNGGRPNARLRELKQFNNDPIPIIDEYSYRFFIRRA